MWRPVISQCQVSPPTTFIRPPDHIFYRIDQNNVHLVEFIALAVKQTGELQENMVPLEQFALGAINGIKSHQQTCLLVPGFEREFPRLIKIHKNV